MYDTNPHDLGILGRFQDPSPVKFPREKKICYHKILWPIDDDYQFALAVQESFKTLTSGFDVEKFEWSQLSIRVTINPAESTAVDEEAMSTNPTSQAIAPPPPPLNLDTLADAVKSAGEAAPSIDCKPMQFIPYAFMRPVIIIFVVVLC